MKNKMYFSYFTLYLKNYLEDIDDDRSEDSDFINQYADRAEIEFEESRRNGLTVDQAQERAMSVLVSGLSED